jgi:hypothetical protein
MDRTFMFNEQMKTTPTVSIQQWENSIFATAKTILPQNDRQGGPADMPLGLFCDPRISPPTVWDLAVATRSINHRQRSPTGNTIAHWLALPTQIAAVGAAPAESDISFKIRTEIWMKTQDYYQPFYQAVVASLPEADRQHV